MLRKPNTLEEGSLRSWEYSKNSTPLYWFAALFLIPTAPLFEHIMTRSSVDTSLFRVLQFVAAAAWILPRFLPARWIQQYHYVWVVSLGLVFPFTYSALLFHNAALTSEALHPLWGYQYLIAIFVLVQMISHIQLSAVLFVAGSLLAASTLFFTDEVNWVSFYENVVVQIPLYLTAFLFVALSNQNIFRVQQEQLDGVAAVGANIAHEMRTPLATIQMLAKGCVSHFGELYSGYEKSREAGLVSGRIRKPQLLTLENALKQISKEVEYSNTVIDILLYNVIENPTANVSFEKFPISEAIEQSLRRFPFANRKEQSLVSLDTKEDFVVSAPRLLVVHVFFNLLKNAVRHAQKSENGYVVISTKKLGKHNLVVVRDSGPGLSQLELRKVFDRFYTTTQAGEGVGVGLSFCKLVMDAVGGSVIAESEEGRFATFTLRFPSLGDDQDFLATTRSA